MKTYVNLSLASEQENSWLYTDILQPAEPLPEDNNEWIGLFGLPEDDGAPGHSLNNNTTVHPEDVDFNSWFHHSNTEPRNDSGNIFPSAPSLVSTNTGGNLVSLYGLPAYGDLPTSSSQTDNHSPAASQPSLYTLAHNPSQPFLPDLSTSQTYLQVVRQPPFGGLSANQTFLPAPTPLDPRTHMGPSHQGGTPGILELERH